MGEFLKEIECVYLMKRKIENYCRFSCVGEIKGSLLRKLVWTLYLKCLEGIRLEFGDYLRNCYYNLVRGIDSGEGVVLGIEMKG